ncbi:MAG TPA: ATP-binding protein [Chitinophagaceae bacterium]
MEPQILNKTTALPEFLSGGGELGQRIRDFDWSKTSLGPVHTWPHSLRTCIRIMLTSRQPIWIGWGKDLIKLYNDPYKAIVAGKHPWALGQPASVVWKEIWREIDPMLKKVMDDDEGTYAESQLLIMERNGYPEETYYTFSYTPIPGDNGGTAGMICANTDDTDRIISERQLKTLTHLGKNLTNCQANDEVISRTIEGLKDNQHDFPFVLFYSIAGDKAVFAHKAHQAKLNPSIPFEIDLSSNSPFALCLKRSIADRKLQLFEGVSEHLGAMPTGAWEVSSDKAIILPILQVSSKDPYGILIVGLNPYRLLDEKYSSFFNLVADQVATSFADVHVLEEERKRAEALAEIDRAKTIFFSNISHEFRTPLTLLLAPIEDVMTDPGITTEHKARMDVAYRNALRMQKLVNTLLEFSRIEAGRMEGKFTEVDICAFTQDLASIFRSAIEKAGMQLIIECDEVTDEVYVDPDMWEQIILNLVSNAFKYSNEGIIRLHIAQSGEQVQVSVSDTGVGIPEDQLDKIFNRFHRIENTEGRSLEGTGIGLAMVKELVRLHRGTVKVTSQPGKGSTFTVSIPVGKDHLPADKIFNASTASKVSRRSAAFVEEAWKWLPSGREESKDESGKTAVSSVNGQPKSKVLLADDNADMRDYVQKLLSDHFEVITAADGEEAYEKALESKPDLLLSDIMMPKMDGFELLKKLRSHPEIKSTPVIFLSARAGEEAKVEGLDAGADDYLVKPFSAKELMVRVINHIRINQVRRETEQQFRNALMNAPSIFLILKGREMVIDYVNKPLMESWGRSMDQLIGKPLEVALPEIKGQPFQRLLEKVFTTGKPHYGREEKAVLIKDGVPQDVYYDYAYTPVIESNNTISGVTVMASDITEKVVARKKIEDSERQYKDLTEKLEVIVDERTEALQRSNDDLQQFAHVASHDLKEPVRKFRIFIDRLAEEYGSQLPDKAKDYLDRMWRASERMSSMIEGVLKYSSLNESEQTVSLLDLDEVINSIESDLEVMIQQKKAVIKKDRLPKVEGAAVLIYQLFYNLINNSLKFSEEVPVIHISSSLVKAGENKFARIVVRDNGIGFEQQDADKIFNAFTRLNSKDKYEGTGLGLALCKKIVERHHGSISASSEEGKGTTFTILLPLVQGKMILT